MYGSAEMVVICDEMVHLTKRLLAGFEVNDETLALDVIREAGYGGNFLKMKHTSKWFRREMFFPSLFRRQTAEEWTKAGSKSIDQAAHEKVMQILETAKPVELLPGADAELERALQHAIAGVPA